MVKFFCLTVYNKGPASRADPTARHVVCVARPLRQAVYDKATNENNTLTTLANDRVTHTRTSQLD